MAMNSVNTNAGALVALQSFNATNRDLAITQNRVNTGQKVASAKDNGAIFAIATGQRAEMGALDAVKNSIQRGQSIVDVALAAGDVITKALEEQKALAVSIQSSVAGSDAETAYLADFNKLGEEILAALGGAEFDGVNLLNSAATTVTVNTNATSNTATIGTAAALNADTDVTAVANATAVVRAGATVANVEAALTKVTTALGTLGSQSKSLERSLTFTSKIQDALEVGIGNLVNADLAKESARLTALQTKQQLGIQALSIANSSSSALLGLFR